MKRKQRDQLEAVALIQAGGVAGMGWTRVISKRWWAVGELWTSVSLSLFLYHLVVAVMVVMIGIGT